MAIFYGTDLSNHISYDGISVGVTSDPTGLTRTTNGDDLVFGYGGDDEIWTEWGNDTVYGGSGDDYIDDESNIGEEDWLYGDAGNDVIIGYVSHQFGGSGDDRLEAYENSTLHGGGGSDLVFLHYDGNAFGGDGADLVVGVYQAANLLNGGAGDDTLIGDNDDRFAAAKDTLIGGLGEDTFKFYGSLVGTGRENFDLIRGAYGAAGAPAMEGVGQAGGDIIDVSEIDANASTASNEVFILGGRGVGHLWVSENGTRTLVLADTDDSIAGPDFKIAIADGDIRASDYTAEEFIL